MARTRARRAGSDVPYRFLISLRPERPERKRVALSRGWKLRALQIICGAYEAQVVKAREKLSYRWFNHYEISRIGAPGIKEFICPKTSYVGRIINQKSAFKARAYWAACYQKSVEILDWLYSIDYKLYTVELHMRLKSYIVVQRSMLSERKRYEEIAKQKILRKIL